MSVLLGITGGIGAGKSYVCALLQSRFGVPVYDCDAQAKRLMAESPAVRAALETIIGQPVCLPDGSLNRPLLASHVFGNPVMARRVEAAVHPAVRADLREWARRHAAQAVAPPVIAFESAILIEAGFAGEADSVVVVEAPEQVRTERVMNRDGATRQQVRSRMSRQLTDAERRLRADFIVCNDGRDLVPVLHEIIEQTIVTKDITKPTVLC